MERRGKRECRERRKNIILNEKFDLKYDNYIAIILSSLKFDL